MSSYFDPAMYPDATLKLVSLNGTFATKSVAIPEGQSILIGRLTDPQDLATIPKFASKVVSRNHASLSHQGGRFYIKDVGSASGTFVSSARMGDKPSRLSEQGKESQWVEIQDNDSVQLGADFEADGAMHRCVYFRINLPRAGSTPAPPYSGSPGVVGSAPSDVGDYSDGSYVDYANDPDVKDQVENEFNSIWSSLTSPLNIRNKLRASSIQGSSSSIMAQPTSPAASTPPALQPGSRQSMMGTPSTTPGGNAEAVQFVKSMQWETPAMQAKVIQLIEAGDATILGYYRSLKQFPSAFANVVVKQLKKNGDA